MPIHDWTRVHAGDFHHFHLSWIQSTAAALNNGCLPADYMALADRVLRPIPDVVERINYAHRANRLLLRKGRGKVVAIIEFLSPGYKDDTRSIRSFVERSAEILKQGIHLLVVDLFLPTPRDPSGIHKAIWDQFGDEPFDFLPEKPLTVASYIGGDLPTAYVDSVGIGDPLPSAPLFLSEDYYVAMPLEVTYRQAWDVYPDMLKDILESRTTEPDDELSEE